ncbi:MAG: hypothetical protein AB1705_24650 [Verrucomicrobiota bacterium]
MKTSTLTLLLQLAGVLHIGLICAGASMPRAVNLHSHVATLPPFIRRLFYVYFTFIGLMLLGFGVITFAFAEALAAGAPLARALCAFLAVFWTVRLVVAALVFDVRPYLINWFYRVGYQATNLAFIYLVLVYVLAAWKGGAP